MSNAGDRCAAKTLLELDHIDPWAREGSNDLENLRVRCRGHNKLHAEACYGQAHIERHMDLRREKYEVLAAAANAQSHERPS